MATLMERPLSALSMPASPSIVPQRRTREPVEVIDVDSFEDPHSRPSQRRRVEQSQPQDVIEVLDSDEESTGDMVAGGSGGGRRREAHLSSGIVSGFGSRSASAHSVRWHYSSTGGAGSSRQARQYISPPPPHFDTQPIPPVPPLPQRYSSFASFHSPVPRPRPPRVPPPSFNINVNEGPSSGSGVPEPIRPLSEPLAFEIPSSPPAPTPPLAHHHHLPLDHEVYLRPAPPARHNPPMGFGGALISTNNARLEAERAERQRRSERRAAGGRVPPAIASTSASSSTRRPHPSRNSLANRLASLNPFRWGTAPDQPVNDVNIIALAQRSDEEHISGDAQLALDLYLQDQEYTLGSRFAHPARDFARREVALLRRWAGGATKDDEDYKKEWTHPGTPEAGFVFDFAPSEILPAVNGKGKGKEVVIDVDADKEGVSTLLVCARCLDPLLLRSEGITEGGEEEARKRKVWALRCGHLIDGKCLDGLYKPLDDTNAPAALDVSDSKGKGKGKGKAVAPAISDKEDEEQELDDLFGDSDAGDLIPTPPMRMRLRSGAALGVPSAFALAAPPSRSRRGRTAKRKGKGKAKPRKPVVEARYEWACPVAGCGRRHMSEKIDGLWVNSADKGAIGLFV
ncbi:hypothetical protein GGX14DRAFT_482610 [Mycena pura]|uniref:Uncharacterized protein n=1 Tax=Mycena pura TaxID=153505 RepID=A0AAD6Y463_9AGAR|nr:hypothetical protein GGX14DRAFT_482610 [Mycena pura]